MYLSGQNAIIIATGRILALDRSFIMPWKQDPASFGAIFAVILSLLSGFLSVASALAKGQKFSLLWLSAQLTGAVLAGWLVWDMFPVIAADVPAWFTQPIATSIAAHYGGKLFSIVEGVLGRRWGVEPPPPPPPTNP